MLKTGLINTLLRGLTIGSKFLLLVFLARILPPEELGVYGLVVVTITIALYLLGFDFYTFNTREILAGEPTDYTRRMRDQLVFHGLAYLAVLPALLVLFAGGTLPWRLAGWFYLLLVLEHLAQEAGRLLITLSRSSWANFVLFLRSGAWVFAVAGVALVRPAAVTLGLVFGLWGAGVGISLMCAGWALRDLRWREGFAAPVDWLWIRRGVGVSLRFFVATLALLGMQYADRYFLQHYHGEAAVGIYTFFGQIANAVQVFVYTAIVSVLFPRLITAHEQGDVVGFRTGIRKLTAGTVGGVALLTAALALGISPLLTIVDKATFTEHLAIFWVLLGSMVMLCLSHVPHYVLYVQRDDRTLVIASLAGLGVGLTANALLVPAHGLMGAAIANASGMGTILVLKGIAGAINFPWRVQRQSGLTAPVRNEGPMRHRPHICFVANYTKTYTFHEVARRLQQAGYRVCWIVVNDKLSKFLSEHYSPDDVLYLSKGHIARTAPKVGEFKVNELVLGDRVLRHSPEEGRRLLVNIQQPIYDFLKQHDIRYVFGELTWAHELLVHRMVERCPELNCRFLSPHTIRIPNGRFAFFTDEFQTEMYAPSANGEVAASSEMPSPAVTLEKPDYLTLNDQLVRNARSLPARLQKIKRFITEENIDPADPTLIDRRWLRFRLRFKEELNKELYRFVRRIKLREVGDRKFVFVALHKQPEASIDVIGRYYENQYTNIVNIWRIIPEDWLLLVKEHTNAIGDRDLSFYRRLTNLPNVHIISESEDSHDIIRRSELVVTVSGTVAYEAALMGKKALTFAPTFFAGFANCRRIGIDDLRRVKDIFELIEQAPSDSAGIEEYVASHSFAGVISDPRSNPKSVEPENVRRLAEAVMSVAE